MDGGVGVGKGTSVDCPGIGMRVGGRVKPERGPDVDDDVSRAAVALRETVPDDGVAASRGTLTRSETNGEGAERLSEVCESGFGVAATEALFDCEARAGRLAGVSEGRSGGPILVPSTGWL